MEPEARELFSCGNCPKTFIKRRDYNKHRKHHDRPHACSLCERRFGIKTDLERHRKTHHKWLTGKDYFCKFPKCKFRGTRRKDYLWTHLKKTHNSKDNHLDKPLRAYFEEFTRGREISQNELDLGLLDAASSGDMERLFDLLSRGANILTSDSRGQTPLYWAMKNSKEEAVDFLIKNGARIESLGLEIGLLYQALHKDDVNVANLLLKKGADVNGRCGTEPHGTVLHHATIRNEVITRILLKAGADFEAKDSIGMTPLDWSTNGYSGMYWKNREICNEATTKLLLEAGASIENCKSYKNPEWVEMVTEFASTCKIPSPQPIQVNDNTTASQEL